MKINFTIYDPTTNNCGPGYSDGKLQNSVSEFETSPVNALDYGCQEHDRSYNLASTLSDLDSADLQFYNRVNNLGFRGILYSNLVYYGNKLKRITGLGENFTSYRAGDDTFIEPIIDFYTNRKPRNKKPEVKKFLYDQPKEIEQDSYAKVEDVVPQTQTYIPFQPSETSLYNPKTVSQGNSQTHLEPNYERPSNYRRKLKRKRKRYLL